MVRRPATSLQTVPISEIEARDIQWLWPGWIPLGKLVLLEGDPDVGKSTLLCDFAARVSAGRSMPEAPPAVSIDEEAADDPVAQLQRLVQSPRATAPDPEPAAVAAMLPALTSPADVTILTAEDSASDTVRPRLDAAEADVRRIHLVTGARDATDETTRPPVFPLDLRPLEEALIATRSRLLIIDPLAAYLGPEVNAYSDTDIRRCLDPLGALAERLMCTILLLRHLNKKPGGPALYRGGGSIGIIASARGSLRVAADPDRPPASTTEPFHGLVASPKFNLGAKPTSLRYTLQPTGRAGICRVDWDGSSPRTAQELERLGDAPDHSALHAATEFLREYLKDGPKPSHDCTMAALLEGISEVTLRRAKEALGVRSVRDSKSLCWRWQLPRKV